MKFSKEFLVEERGRTLVEKLIGHGRWSLYYERIFEHEGKCYRTTFSRGATENQDEQPYEYAPDEIECEEVTPVQKFVTVYEVVKTNDKPK